MSKILLNAEEDAVITIWDATYIYIEKSSSYDFQRKTYSGHKFRSLVKFMICCSTDGYMIEFVGPYLCNGNNNDANITQDIFEKNYDDISQFFYRNDVFVVDRGFRDSLNYLDSKGFKYQMPSFLKDKKQHSSIEANQSRIVTKIRWVIESVNSRIKKWKYFSNVLINKNIEFIEKDFRNICALINKYRPQIATTEDDDKFEDYRKMLKISEKENTFLAEMAKYSNRIKKNAKCVDSIIINFPKLTEEYICSLTFGIYQLKQAKSYTAEHIDENGNYLFQMFYADDDETVIHVKLGSRFSKSVIHKTRIKYDCNLKLIEGQNPITQWCCDCKAGARVFGMCAQVASILWFLGIARHEDKLMLPRKCDLFKDIVKTCLEI